MPERRTLARARRDQRQGKAPTTQAGEFIREEMHHIREGKHGARSPQQAIAIGLSKARRAGVALKPPAPGRASNQTRRKAERDLARGRSGNGAPNPRRSAATEHALEREPRTSASPRALSGAALSAARRRGSAAAPIARRRRARPYIPRDTSGARPLPGRRHARAPRSR